MRKVLLFLVCLSLILGISACSKRSIDPATDKRETGLMLADKPSAQQCKDWHDDFEKNLGEGDGRLCIRLVLNAVGKNKDLVELKAKSMPSTWNNKASTDIDIEICTDESSLATLNSTFYTTMVKIFDADPDVDNVVTYGRGPCDTGSINHLRTHTTSREEIKAIEMRLLSNAALSIMKSMHNQHQPNKVGGDI